MNTATIPNGRVHLALGEIFSFAYETFMSNKVRFALTALGMVIGTASLILVTTIGLTGKQYLLNQIQAIGANWVYVEYESGGERITNTGNHLQYKRKVIYKQQYPGDRLKLVLRGIRERR